ncbi:hypothetical protein AVEN_170525-1 [Araneus ventricosus]|uniref:Uncharacterized protein n=1 Tax=Araneus ventricosus TaxID=182803 RepID=A0A4Y2C021_ARAVE|nr:hypothetical protein AVEN_170525-1 [Araneus ventricosus]
MSDERSWINPCGLDMEDGKCIKKRRHSLKENIPNIESIENAINVILEQLEDLKKLMSSMFNVNEDTLTSQKYSFLNPPKDVENTYVRAFHILQANVMAIEELTKKSEKEIDTHRIHLNEIKEKLILLLCSVQMILISEGLCYIDVTEDMMSEQFKNKKGFSEILKHFIAFRQIRNNMKYLSDEFKKINLLQKRS